MVHITAVDLASHGGYEGACGCVLLLLLLLQKTRGRPSFVPGFRYGLACYCCCFMHNRGTQFVGPRVSMRFTQSDVSTHLPVISPPTADTRVGNQSVTCIMLS